MKAGTKVPGPKTCSRFAALSAAISYITIPATAATNLSSLSTAITLAIVVPNAHPLPVISPSNSCPFLIVRVRSPVADDVRCARHEHDVPEP